MASNLILKNIYFGKTDAKNELNENTPEQRKNFKDTFLLPAQFNLSDFVEGKKYFIYGLKGTGKTAFLRYLSIYIEDDLKKAKTEGGSLFAGLDGDDDEEDC